MSQQPPSETADSAPHFARDRLRFAVPQMVFSREVPAWLLSLVIHLIAILALSLLVRVTYTGAAIEGDRAGGIVLAVNVDGKAEYFRDATDQTHATTTDTSPSDPSTALPTAAPTPIDFAGMLPKDSGIPEAADSASMLPSANDMATDLRPSGGQVRGNQVRTGVFGVEGTGTKFVYVFDRSASMSGYGGRPLAAAKRELVASLADLDDIHQFQIIFYNDRPMVFNPNRPQPPRMLYGNATTKRLAQNFVHAIVAAGGTQHLEALKLALGMQPEVIFFLTDADEPALTPSQLDSIRRLNARVGATINAIEFGVGSPSGRLNFLMRLAKQNGGQYAYVDVTRLPHSP